ncbi:MAG: hypothetical protein COB04_12265 [Gammaproteobacteria bacterium]|nr:MAG: hypothetical protein COB04_12265 [Gammaproteobacteria bacterium]
MPAPSTVTVQVTKPQQTSEQKVQALAVAAMIDIKNNRLKHPKESNAFDKVNQIEALVPQSPQIILLREKIAQQYTLLIKLALGEEDLSKAKLYLSNAQDIAKNSASIQQAQDWISAYQQEQKRRQAEQQKQQMVAKLQTQKRITQERNLNQQKQHQRSLRNLPQKHRTPLIQSEINARSKEVGFQLDKLSVSIIENNRPITIRAQSQRDFRWLAALLKTSLYVVDSNFEPVISHEINSSSTPAIYYLVPQL